MRSNLYYEAHVTIEPVLDALSLEQLQTIAQKHTFRIADLLMKKREHDTPERSQYDTFMTTRHEDYETIYQHMVDLVLNLATRRLQSLAPQVGRHAS